VTLFLFNELRRVFVQKEEDERTLTCMNIDVWLIFSFNKQLMSAKEQAVEEFLTTARNSLLKSHFITVLIRWS
jgi:hypothetical protein